MKFQIRKARPGDEGAIHKAHMTSINKVCVKDHGEEISGWGSRALGDRWTISILTEFVWVVEFENEVCGVGHFRPIDKKTGHLHALYLMPEVVGSGMGAKLMRLILDEANKLNLSEMVLLSSITAHEFYKSFGFMDTGDAQKVFIGGRPVTCYPMRKCLESS